MREITIAMVGDHDPSVTAHRANPLALALAGAELGITIRSRWIGTEALADGVTDELDTAAGVWCVPATPYRSEAGALNAIRFAREQRRPFLGTCGGFQHALLEYARNVLGIEAQHAESPSGSTSVPDFLITPLTCGLVEVSGEVTFEPGSRLARLYRSDQAIEGYHCNYGLNPAYESVLTDRGLKVIARDGQGDVRAMELTGHPFYLLTLFQPERSGLAGRIHPIVKAFVDAAAFAALAAHR